MPRRSRDAIVIGSALAALVSLFAGMWLTFGLGWALIAAAPVLAGLAFGAWLTLPDDRASSTEPPPPASATIPPVSAVPPIVTPRVRAHA